MKNTKKYVLGLLALLIGASAQTSLSQISDVDQSESDVDQPEEQQPSIPAVDQAAVLQGFPGVQGQFEGGEFMERLEESESDVDQSESDVDQSESDVEEPSSAFDLF